MGKIVTFGGLLGLAASLYAFYVELEIAEARSLGGEYKAACDMGAFSSCSKVLGSSYAHILSHFKLVPRGSSLDISNALLGAAFYIYAMLHNVLPLPARRQLFFAASIGSLAFSGFLMYVLKFILNDFCLVCATMYVANAIVFIGAARGVLRGKSSGKAIAGKDKDL